MSAIAEHIQLHCPSLRQRLDRPTLLRALETHGISCDTEQLTRIIEAQYLVSAGGFSSTHLLLIDELIRCSTLPWFPWDEARPDRVPHLQSRIDGNKTRWHQLSFDARCIAEMQQWLDSDQQDTAFPLRALVRLSALAERSTKMARHESLNKVAGELNEELSSLLEAAADVLAVSPPSPADVQPPSVKTRGQLMAEIPKALFARPDFDTDPEAVGVFITRRDHAILWRDWQQLAKQLHSNEALFQSPTSRAQWHHAVGVLGAQYLEPNEEALEHLIAARAHAPKDPALLAQLAGLLETLKRWSERLALFEEQIDLAIHSHVRERLKLEQALLMARADINQVQDALAALEALEESPALSPEEWRQQLEEAVQNPTLAGEVTLYLIERLEAVWGEASLQTLADLYAQAASRLFKPSQLAKLHQRQALLSERSGDHEAAFTTALDAVALQPQQDALLDLLNRLSTTEVLQQQFLKVLKESLATLPASQLETRALLNLHASRQYTLLGDTEEATRQLESARDADPSRQDVLVELAEQYSTQLQHGAAIETLEVLRSMYTDAKEIAELDAIIAPLRSAIESDPKATLAYYQRKVSARSEDSSPDDEVVEGLSVLVEHEDTDVGVDALLLLDVVLSAHNPVALAGCYARLLERLPPEGDSWATLLERALEYLVSAGDDADVVELRRRFAVLIESRAADPSDPSANEQHSALLERAASLHTDRAEQARLLCGAGGLLATKDEHRARAEKLLTRAVAAQPQRVETIDQLLRLYRHHNMRKKLVRTLEYRLNKTPKSAATIRAKLFAELANVAQAISKYSSAINALKALLNLASAPDLKAPIDTLLVRRNLATLQAANDDLDGAILTLQETLNEPRFERSPAPFQGELLGELASLQLTQGQNDAAAQVLDLARELTPDDHRLVVIAADLEVERERWTEARELLEPLLDVNDDTVRAAVLSRLGFIFTTNGDSEHASLVYEQLIILDPGHAEALSFLKKEPS